MKENVRASVFAAASLSVTWKVAVCFLVGLPAIVNRTALKPAGGVPVILPPVSVAHDGRPEALQAVLPSPPRNAMLAVNGDPAVAVKVWSSRLTGVSNSMV